MGLLALNRLMSMQPDWRRRPTQRRNGLVTSSVAKRKVSPCLHDDNSGSVKKSRYSGPPLPEVDADRVRQESVLAESSHDLRQMPGHVHRNIKDVFIIGFCSAKSMVELTCHMLENAKSLEYLTLNTSSNPEISCSDSENGRCLPMSKHMRKEARKALLAVERYILGKVPCSVELEVVKPCSRCNTLEI
ncbi:unnamed protein product [Triticum turgidum subsp. durum]|uniref:At1g61320/AtMIF1 LRR domain-containing protein n=1 Tax=Triticum turgidum subsp. durum TaxID=4567 RepID=A0A9R0TT39_TRITD|nr:unnamed protein product [Triticum turgidum subsp. durum]